MVREASWKSRFLKLVGIIQEQSSTHVEHWRGGSHGGVREAPGGVAGEQNEKGQEW